MAKFTAHEWIKPEISIAQLFSATDSHPGNWIDCEGFGEALVTLDTSQMGGTTPTEAVIWYEADDDPANPGSALASGKVAIAGAVFNTVLVAAADIVASVLPANGAALTLLLAAPGIPAPGRLTFDLTSSGITDGTITIVGTRPPLNIFEQDVFSPNTTEAQATAQTEVITLSTYGWSTGVALYSKKLWASVTSITQGTYSGSIGSDTITVGFDNSGPLCPQVGRFGLFGRKRYIAAYSTKGGSGQTGGFVAGVKLFGAYRLPVIQVLPTVFAL